MLFLVFFIVVALLVALKGNKNLFCFSWRFIQYCLIILLSNWAAGFHYSRPAEFCY